MAKEDKKPDRVSEVMGGKKKDKKPIKKKGGKKPKKIHVRRSANGGFIAENEFGPDEQGITSPNEEHTLASLDELKNHMSEHMGPEEPESQDVQRPAAV